MMRRVRNKCFPACRDDVGVATQDIIVWSGLVLFVGMEGFAYVAHRWIMHDDGWLLHESHHGPRTGNWELNNLYAAIFAVSSFILLLGNVRLGWWGAGWAWIGVGIAE